MPNRNIPDLPLLNPDDLSLDTLLELYHPSGINVRSPLEDVLGFVLDENPWSSSNSLIRRVIYTTGATSVPMGETASSSGVGGGVTAKAVSSTNPQGATFTTGSSSGNTFGWNSTAHHLSVVPVRFEFHIELPETANVRYLVGVGSNSMVNMSGSGNTPGTAFHLAMLRWSTSVPDTNLQFLTGNASAQTVTDLGVAKPSGAFRMSIVFRSSGTAVDVYINGVLCAEGISTTLPGVSTALQMTGGVTTLTGAGKVAHLYEEASAAQY